MAARFERDRLIIRLYEAAGNSAGVTAALSEIGASLGASAGQVLVSEKATGQIIEDLFYAREDLSAQFGAYERYWRQRDPRFAIAARAPGEVHSDIAVIEPAAFERTEICNDLLLPSGVRYTMFCNADAGGELALACAFMRPPTDGGFQGAEVEHMKMLLPHLSAALRAHVLVSTLSSENRELRAALDHVPSAVVILDARGRVVSANRAAEEILAKGDGLTTRDGALTAVRRADAARLAANLNDVTSLATDRSRTPAPSSPVMIVHRAQGSPLELVLFPLFERSAGPLRGRVLAVINDPDRAVSLDPELVARLHGLTATEAELAVTLAAGRSLTNFAAERGCSEQTARTHLKRIFAKTGLTRQAELVRALLLGAALRGTLGPTRSRE